jgi:hypothetical protein
MTDRESDERARTRLRRIPRNKGDSGSKGDREGRRKRERERERKRDESFARQNARSGMQRDASSEALINFIAQEAKKH